jgi:predicted phosphodiesterase
MVVFPCNLRATRLLPLVCAASVACGSERSPSATLQGSGSPDGAVSSTSGVLPGSDGTPSNGSSTTAGGSTPGATPSEPNSSIAPGASSTPPDETTGGSLPTEPTPGPLALSGAPLVFTPSADAFSVSVVLTTGDPAYLRARVRKAGTETWSEAQAVEVREVDLGEHRFTGLEAATRYEYQILDGETEESRVLFDGKALTQRGEGADFTFAMISDTHIGVNLDYSNQGDATVTAQISSELAQSDPDFLVHLGDILDYHQFGFNVPPSDPILSRWAYQNYRGAMGNTIGQVAHFSALGNWDGENGEFTSQEIARSRDQRMLYLPNASPDTYPQGGSPGQDYYAFTWGDATFVVLNVMSYTLTPHLLTGVDEFADDWTLGAAQLAWLEKTLSEATTKWKFTFIHHTVGGAGPNFANAAYGRGGGQAAKVGEQAIIHQMLLDYGVQIFFYGHDHVFVDMTVDGVHYSDPGSAGAPWKFETVETGYTEYWTDSGWSRVNVSPDEVHVEFLAQGGALLHQYWIPERPDAGVPDVTSSAPTSEDGASGGTAAEATTADGTTDVNETPDASL